MRVVLYNAELLGRWLVVVGAVVVAAILGLCFAVTVVAVVTLCGLFWSAYVAPLLQNPKFCIMVVFVGSLAIAMVTMSVKKEPEQQ